MNRKIITALLVVSACTLFAQAADPLQGKRFIEVTGTNESEIVPDELYVTITLLERMEGKEKVAIDKQEAQLKQSLKELNIDLSNLSLNTANADYGKVRRSKKDVLVSKSYILKVGTADQLSKVYEKLDQINAHDAFISRYTHSKILDFQKESRIKALKAAKEKVDYLLAAVGQQAGAPLQIMESENFVQENPNPYMPMYKNSMAMVNDSVSGDAEISFKKIKLRSSFIVKYEIATK